MSEVLEYSREGANIFKEDRLFPEGHACAGKIKGLAKDIEEAFPGKKFILRCNGDMMCVCVSDGSEFSDAEKTTLNSVIQGYKDNT